MENPFPGLYKSCPEHDYVPPRGPAGQSAKALCPGCVAAQDLAAGRTELDELGAPRPRKPGRVVREGGLVSDGPLVGEREPARYETEVWSRYLAEQEDRRRVESYALIRIEELREQERKRQEPRKRRVQFSKYENGEHVVIYAPERRAPVEFELEDEY